jgi:murein L,D-transpeptidase YcbB/YkuD
MGILRLVAIGLVGAVWFAAPSAPSSAKGTDNPRFNQAFAGQKGLKVYNYKQKKYKRRDYRRRYWFDNQRYSDRGFSQFRKQRLYAERKRKRRLNYEGFDPEPVKPKSPDDGFGAYQPVQLVSLQNSKLEAPMPDQVLASTILHEIKDSHSPVRVTARQRDSIISFYRLNIFAPLWVGSEGLNDRAKRVLTLLAKAEEEGLNAADYLPPSLSSFADDASGMKGDVASLARLDLELSALTVRYAEHLHSGRIIPNRLSGYYDIDPPKLDLGIALYELSVRGSPDAYLRSLAPSHPAYAAMKAHLAKLGAKSTQTLNERLPHGGLVKLGVRDARVPLVRIRMVELGYLNPDDAMAWMLGHAAEGLDVEKLEETLDKATFGALKAFQAANKIKQTGFIGKATIEALNSPVEGDSVEKLVFNMERLRWLPRDLGERYVFVNQAAFELRLMDRDNVAWRTKVIVGKPETQTAVFSDQMETVVINPYWGVPQSIIRHEMMPRLARDRRYLDRLGYEVLNAKGKRVSSRAVNWWAYGSKIPFAVRQPPGDDNALGRIKFLFPNSHDIYMHDTPTKELFEESVRAFSHGCVRVENPREFAEYVLGWERQRIDDMIATGENKNVRLDKHIPVHLSYFTAWPDESGNVIFYQDIYGRDVRMDKALNRISMAAN